MSSEQLPDTDVYEFPDGPPSTNEDQIQLTPPENVKASITITETIAHRLPGDEATGVDYAYSRQLVTTDEPYSRKMQATEEWQLLDTGWLKGNVGLLSIHNLEGRFPFRIPTPEQVAEANKKIIELNYLPGSQDGWLILPRESMRAHPREAGLLYIRCAHGAAKYTLSLYPK